MQMMIGLRRKLFTTPSCKIDFHPHQFLAWPVRIVLPEPEIHPAA